KPQPKSGDRKLPKPIGRAAPSKPAELPSPPKSQSTSRDGKNIVIGRFRRTARGFGFVRPQGSKRGDKSSDAYIAAGATMDGSDRDTVRVRLSRKNVRGKGGALRLAGEIVAILERDTHQFVGVYKERGGTGFVEVDGKVFVQPVPVGDPGAK